MNPKEARKEARQLTAQAKLEKRAIQSRVAETLAVSDGWAEALTSMPRTAYLDNRVKLAAHAFDAVRNAKATLDVEPTEDAAMDAVVAGAVLNARKAELKALATKDRMVAGAIFAASVEQGLVSPIALRKALADAGLARSIEREVADAKAELTAALDAAENATLSLEVKSRT